jgi:gliding motility-associated-like protein
LNQRLSKYYLINLLKKVLINTSTFFIKILINDKKVITVLFIMILLYSHNLCYAQLEARYWYFGNSNYGPGNGLRFDSGQTLQLADGKMKSIMGCSAISDKKGNLLFYTHGETIWNSKHDTIKNGGKIKGQKGSMQGAVIVPLPGNPYLYYVFTLSRTMIVPPGYDSGLFYHIVDMRGDNGKGEVTLKDKVVYHRRVAMRMAATFHANKKSIWIVIHEWNSNKFRAYLLTSNGLDTNAIISSIGTVNKGNPDNEWGQMKFTPSGNKLAHAIAAEKIVEIFDFDNKTGKVSNCIKLNSSIFNYSLRVWGLEFSPNERFLYATCQMRGAIYQIDISSGIDSIIFKSIVLLASSVYYPHFLSLQIGLDKKIYLSRCYWIACINNPDEKGTACNYKDTVFTFPFTTEVQCFPTFLQSYFYLPDIEIKNTCLGDTVRFGLRDTFNIDSVYWQFSDSSSSWSYYPYKVYIDTGNYKVNAIIYYDNTSDTFERNFRISSYPNASYSITNTSQCPDGNLFHFSNTSSAVDGAMTYEWDFGDSTKSFQQNPVKSYLISDTFDVRLTVTSAYGCESSFYDTLIVYPKPKANFSINDSAQCFNENSFIFFDSSTISSGTLAYHWDLGDSQTINTSQKQVNYSYKNPDTHTYPVRLIAVSDQVCKDTIVKQIVIYPSPTAVFSINDSTQCFNEQNYALTDLSTISGDSITQKTWNWDTNTLLNQPTISFNNLQPGTLNLKLITSTNHGCPDTIEKQLIVYPSPLANFSINDPNQCFNEQKFVLNDLSKVMNDSIIKRNWLINDSIISNLESINNLKLQKPGTYDLKLISVTSHGCPDTTLEKQLIVFPNPTISFSVSDTVQCFNGNKFIFDNTSTSSDGQKISSFWNLGEITSNQKNISYSFKTFGTKVITLVSKTDSNCYDTSKFELKVFPSPKADFIVNDTVQCFKEQNFIITNKSTISSGYLVSTWHIYNDSFTTTTLQLSNLKPGTQNVELRTISDFNCTNSITKTLTVYPSPSSSFIVNDTAQCLNSNSFNFTNTSVIQSGTLTSEWVIVSKIFNTSDLIDFKFANWNKFPVQLISTSDWGCSDTSESYVYVFPNPVSAFVYLNNCIEDTMWFFDNSYSDSGSIQQWYWDFRNGQTSSIKNPYTIYYDTGYKSVELISTNDFGCSHATTRFFKIETHVSAPELDRVSVENDEYINVEWNPPKEGVAMKYHLEKSTDSIIWNHVTDFNNSIFNYIDKQTNVDLSNYFYRLSVTDSCKYTSPYSNIGKTILLTIDTNGQFPVITWSPYELWASGIERYELQIAGYSKWVNPKAKSFMPLESFIQPEMVSDSLSKLNNENYCYRVVAFRQSDQLESVSNEVCIPAISHLFIPNAFSPNHDGLNDVFKPIGMYILDYNIQIFNKWGVKLFESNDMNTGWNGKFKEVDCTVDNYFYQLSAKCTNGKNIKKSGSVLLMR